MKAFASAMILGGISSWATAAERSVQQCSLDCPVDAPCTMGEAEFPHQNAIQLKTSVQNMHCACPPGWTGIMCDHKYESCTDSHDCFHGGQCLNGSSTDSFGNHQLFCDCSGAKSTDGIRYVGKYCETPFEKSCSADNEELFCVNGGDCNPNYSNDGIACLCPEGWEGFHCEFKKNEVPDCTLECFNEGVCIVGIRSPTEVNLLRRIWSDEEISEHMRCVCPTGYGGPLCQSISEECGDNFCFHGGTCVITTTTIHGDSKTEYHCDCTSATDRSGNRFAGDYCQEVSTSFCDANDASLFCTNGGRCNSSGDPAKPCECPDGFSGHKCEYDTRPSTQEYFNNGVDEGEDDGDSSVPCGEIFCLNGAKCTTQNVLLENGTQGKKDVCDCTTAHKPALYQAFAGEACQYISTSVCASSGDQEIRFCVNGGVCDSTSDNSSYCSCPIGWSGQHCEISNKQHRTDTDPLCGDTVCHNGGTCVETTISVPSSDGGTTTSVEYYCDCTKAFDDKFIYSGKSCEFKSTSFCSLPAASTVSLEGVFFCTNHGSCRQNIQHGCDCLDGFSGFHCEFLELSEDPNNDSSQQEFVAASETCGENLVCKNGGKCVTSIVQSDGGKQHIKHCDCSTTSTDSTIFAGAECEHEVTSFCTQPVDGDGMETPIFCVQGGQCKSNVHEGCDCPVGWTGFHCEYSVSAGDLLGENVGESDSRKGPNACGDFFCYNGGVCEVVREVNEVTGELDDLYLCDCSTTATATEIYGGPTCSFKSTSVCQPPNSDNGGLAGALVCLNHGTCRDDPLEGCDCPSGFTGTMCEFEVDDDSHAGQGEICGDKYCYNGGKCATISIVGDDGGKSNELYCDCNAAGDGTTLFAGDSCQYKATAQCTHPQDGESLQGMLFCVNGGTCQDEVQKGCSCPVGWTGFFCEFQQDSGDVHEQNTDELEACGDHVCLNGGVCVSTIVKASDGSQSTLNYCDCNLAFNEESIFAGPNCEYQATVLCTEPGRDSKDLAGVQFCVNGGKCPEDNILGECECPMHWTGMRCEIEVDDLQESGSTPCGDITCFHHGKCLVSNEGGSQKHSCDCSTAFDELHRYDGPFCQYQSTQFCSKPESTLAKVDFCVNNGECQEDGTCRCPSGFYGPRCELTVYEDQALGENEAMTNAFNYTCRLSCSNGGYCVKGVKDNGIYQDTIKNVAHLNQTYHETYFEHCICPDGFIGLTCEHQIETCTNGEHYCLHGSTCVKENEDYLCDCRQADETIGRGDHPTVFAGDSCEHPANDICVQGHIYPTTPLYFCVNQGICRAYVSEGDDDPGCDCPSDWSGPHCEVRNNEASANRDGNPEASSNYVIVVVTTLVVVLLLIWFIRYGISVDRSNAHDWMCLRRRRRKHEIFDDPNARTNDLDPNECSSSTCSSKVTSIFQSSSSSGIVSPRGNEERQAQFNIPERSQCGTHIVECDYDNDELVLAIEHHDGTHLQNVVFT